jgi:hypothetical protein
MLFLLCTQVNAVLSVNDQRAVALKPANKPGGICQDQFESMPAISISNLAKALAFLA